MQFCSFFFPQIYYWQFWTSLIANSENLWIHCILIINCRIGFSNKSFSKMKRNAKDNLFVDIQLILFVAYLFRFSKIDFSVPGWLQATGLFISFTGIIVLLTSIITLNKNLSPFPTPRQSATLVQSGIYKYIRHPIYSGILFFTLGFSMYSENTLRLLIFFMLLILFRFKAVYEEKLLQNKFSNYAAYKKKTGMFFIVKKKEIRRT